MLTSAAAFAGKDDCKNIKANKAPKPAQKVGKEKLATTNDYDKVVEKDKRKGVVYLAFIGGGKAKPNGCGLKTPVMIKQRGLGGAVPLIAIIVLLVKVQELEMKL